MSNVIDVPADIEPPPIEIDPRSCGECGLTIDQHRMVDTGEGPEFFCIPPDEIEMDELERRAELSRLIEIAEIMAGMAGMEAMDGPAKPPPAEPRRYNTPQATADAFMFVARLDDQDYLARWLAAHKPDAPHLLKIWKAKQC